MRYYEKKKAVVDGQKAIRLLEEQVLLKIKEINDISENLQTSLDETKAEILNYGDLTIDKELMNDLLVIGNLNSLVIDKGDVKVTIHDISGRDKNFIKNNSKIRVNSDSLSVKKIPVPDQLDVRAKIVRGNIVDMVFGFAEDDLTVTFDMTIGC